MSLEPYTPDSLMARTRSVVTLAEDELRRFATEGARDRDADALWALTETHLTLHGSAGSQVSPRTLSAYHHALGVLLQDWAGESLRRPSRNASVLWIRELESRKPSKGTNPVLSPATVRLYLAAAKPSMPPCAGRVQPTPHRLPTSASGSTKLPPGPNARRTPRPKSTGSSAAPNVPLCLLSCSGHMRACELAK